MVTDEMVLAGALAVRKRRMELNGIANDFDPAIPPSAEQLDLTRAALTAALSDQVVVPKAALDWLNGEGPDADGKWFGDTEPRVVPGKTWPRYWWRSKFRAMIAATPPSKGVA